MSVTGAFSETTIPSSADAVRARAASNRELVNLADVPVAAWARLAGCALDPNAFYDPLWARPAAAHSHIGGGTKALLVWDSPARHQLIGMLPVVSAWRALKLPIPMLVAWQAYAPLTTPLLDRDCADSAAGGLVDAASAAGAQALLLPHFSADGPAAAALRGALAARGIAPYLSGRHERACLNAARETEKSIYDSMGIKKVKELRRQRNRLADHGAVTVEIASGADTPAALEHFLALEAQGWQGQRGTALALHPGDARFIREAIPALAAQGHSDVITLARGGVPVAAGLVLRHARRAFFIKIAYDESLAKTSPGVQLTLDLSRHLCDDSSIDDADSIATAGHPMIDHVWRGRLAIADMMFATRRGDSFVTLARGLIAARGAARNAAKQVFHSVRALKETMR